MHTSGAARDQVRVHRNQRGWVNEYTRCVVEKDVTIHPDIGAIDHRNTGVEASDSVQVRCVAFHGVVENDAVTGGIAGSSRDQVGGDIGIGVKAWAFAAKYAHAVAGDAEHGVILNRVIARVCGQDTIAARDDIH